MKKHLEDIDKMVERLVRDRVNKEIENIKIYKDNLQDLVSHLEGLKINAESTYEMFKKENLTMSMIEAEGALRMIRDIWYYVEEWKMNKFGDE